MLCTANAARRVSGGGELQHPVEKKGKAFNPALLMEGPIADAINELRAVVAQARPSLFMSVAHWRPAPSIADVTGLCRRLRRQLTRSASA